MTLPAICFSHGNGFPAGTYRRLFDVWRAAGHAVHALDKFGHDPDHAVGSNWPGLRDQLIRFVEREVPTPALLVGHSLGGVLSLLAASRRPELVCGLVLLDSPVVTGWRAHSLHVVKAAGLIERIGPGRVARRRRHEWPSREAVRQHFVAKPVFARWDPRVLDDYVEAGFEEHDGLTRLAFRREVETRIYNTLPHHLSDVLRRRPLACPCAFIAGTRSAEMRQGGFEASKALAKQHFAWIDGSHLFPMEKPEQTAAEVLRLIAAMAGARPPA